MRPVLVPAQTVQLSRPAYTRLWSMLTLLARRLFNGHISTATEPRFGGNPVQNLASDHLRWGFCDLLLLLSLGIFQVSTLKCRSQWAHWLRHELSSLARMLGSWVRIPLKVWMSVCAYSVFVLFCVYVAALRRADPPSKESYRLCIGLKSWKSVKGPTKTCRAIDSTLK
jgi:hypothetical protein